MSPDHLQEIADAIIEGDDEAVVRLTQSALDAQLSAEQIIDGGMMQGMAVVGDRFKRDLMFIPEVMMSAQAMNKGMELVRPHIVPGAQSKSGKVIIGTVQGDMHDIGKNLVKMMLEASSLDVLDLGVDVSPATFVENVASSQADVVCMSALLTTTMPSMADTIDALKEAGIRDRVKVMVGGSPVTADFAREIGADGYEPDAGSAAQTALSLCKS
jgi:5-methyltetrahydrofolate--homocysteine methyltransferase